MISQPVSRPTVLILGAGASMPYKFPSGEGLFNTVRRVSHQYLIDQIKPTDPSQAAPLQLAVKESLDRSLDALLELRLDLVEAGKAFMGRYLLQAEKSDREVLEDSEEAWYRTLWDAFDLSSPEAFRRTPLTILTYNYDRSLEYWLMGALRQRFRLSIDECAPLLEQVGPIHLHGQLGYLPGFKAKRQDIVAYGSTPDAAVSNADCVAAARNIRIVHEPKPEDDAFVRARIAIANAERVAFLGFGYARRNIERLRLAECMQPSTSLYLCIKGYTHQQEHVLIRPHFQSWTVRVTSEPNEGIVEFFRRYPEVLT